MHVLDKQMFSQIEEQEQKQESSVHGDLAWEPEGDQLKASMDRWVQVAGEVPPHLLGTVEVTMSKAHNPPDYMAVPSFWHLST